LAKKQYRERARECFVDNGKVKHPWETAIQYATLQVANDYGIPFIIYGEEGGAEYGGWGGYKHSWYDWKQPVDANYLKEYYSLGKEMYKLPENFDKMFFTQWSLFENWSPKKHSDFAIEKGMKVITKEQKQVDEEGRELPPLILPGRSPGTFTNDSQLSDKLQALHMYILFIKFGFGRATADACIAIRDGWLSRDLALERIENYDDEFPNTWLPEYLDYLRMTYSEFCEVLEKHANPELMEQHTHPKARHSFYLKNWIKKMRREGTEVGYTSPGRFDVK